MDRLTAKCLIAVLLGAVTTASTFAQPKTGKKPNPFAGKAKSVKTAPPSKRKPPAKKATGTEAAPKAKTSPVDEKAIAEWKTLDQRRKAIGGELMKLEVKFSVASRTDKLKIKKQFEDLLAEWNTKVEPQMQKIAFRVFESDPDNDMALGMVIESNRYAEIAAVTGRLINAGHDRSDIIRAAFNANFHMNRFEKAKEILETAEKKIKLKFDTALMLEEANKHIELWKKEQALREAEKKAPPEKRLPRVRIVTNRGPIEVVLLENQAPNTVANFISLIEKQKLYDGVRIHDDYIDAVTGSPETKENFNPERPFYRNGLDYTIKCECFEENARPRFRTSVSMHHSGERDSGGSMFEFVRRTLPRINTTPPGRGSRTVFGYVDSGMDVVDALKKGDTIEKVTVISKRDHPYKPVTSNDPEEGSGKPKDEGMGKTKTDPKPTKKSSGEKKPAGKSATKPEKTQAKPPAKSAKKSD